jgi:hypothetical protein
MAAVLGLVASTGSTGAGTLLVLLVPCTRGLLPVPALVQY